MQLNGFSFNENRLKRLDAKTVERRSAVQENRMLFHNFVENIPNFLALFFDHLLCALDGRNVTVLRKFVVNKWFEKLERHLFWQTALMQLQLRTDNDN